MRCGIITLPHANQLTSYSASGHKFVSCKQRYQLLCRFTYINFANECKYFQKQSTILMILCCENDSVRKLSEAHKSTTARWSGHLWWNLHTVVACVESTSVRRGTVWRGRCKQGLTLIHICLSHRLLCVHAVNGHWCDLAAKQWQSAS